jgi:peptide/nickel transport system permease protein
MSTARFIARRAGFYLVAVWVAITVSFFLPRMVPGNPVAGIIARMELNGQCNAACVSAAISQFGLHGGNIFIQYLQYWGNLFHGNLGISYFESSQPVTTLIAAYLPWTIGLLGVATVISFLLGITIGIFLDVVYAFIDPRARQEA